MGEYMNYFIIVFRTLFIYFFIIIIFRIMGKREIGELSIQDFVVSILMAELAALSIENFKSSILYILIPIILLCILEVLFGYLSLKNENLRGMIDGKPVLIIDKGKICINEMMKQRYTLEDLLLELRNNGIKNIKDVEFAILENNGKLNIFKYDNKLKDNYFPFPLILDGVIQYETLKYLNKSDEWLVKHLNKKGVFLDEVFYGFYKDDNIYIIKNNELIR